MARKIVLVYPCGFELYAWGWREGEHERAICEMACAADNPELSITWREVAILASVIREEVISAEERILDRLERRGGG